MAATASRGLWWRSPCANADVNKDVTTGRSSTAPNNVQLIDLEKGAARAEDRIGKQDQRILELEQTLARQQPSERQRDVIGSGSNNAHDDHDKGLWSRIKAGRSFVDSSSKFCPWQFPSDPHGTQMANLICALDPTCEIYVARVAEDAFGINPDIVTKVDIISMSFAMSDSDDAMEKMVRAASSRGIVMTCSAHDEGSRVNQAWPAACRNFDHLDESIIVLAACDKYGKLLCEADTKKLDFKILGEHVPAGVVPLSAHPGKEYNNATMGEAGNGRHAEDQYRLGIVKKHLNKMETSDGSKFIELGNFGGMRVPRIGQDVVAQWGGKLTNLIPSVEEVLVDEFGMMKPQRHSTFKTR
ncbi:hypothetical protein NHJ13734_003214 [Beauveria thailandica]